MFNIKKVFHVLIQLYAWYRFNILYICVQIRE